MANDAETYRELLGIVMHGDTARSSPRLAHDAARALLVFHAERVRTLAQHRLNAAAQNPGEPLTSEQLRLVAQNAQRVAAELETEALPASAGRAHLGFVYSLLDWGDDPYAPLMQAAYTLEKCYKDNF